MSNDTQKLDIAKKALVQIASDPNSGVTVRAIAEQTLQEIEALDKRQGSFYRYPEVSLGQRR